MMRAGSLGGATLAAAGDINLVLAETQDGVLAVFTWINRAACAKEWAIPTVVDVKSSFQVFAASIHGNRLALRTGQSVRCAAVSRYDRELGQRYAFRRRLCAANGALDVDHIMGGGRRIRRLAIVAAIRMGFLEVRAGHQRRHGRRKQVTVIGEVGGGSHLDNQRQRVLWVASLRHVGHLPLVGLTRLGAAGGLGVV